jgi:hypothetical protein
MIPHTVWMYWHDRNPPDLVIQCVHRVRDLNPSWRVTLLSLDIVRAITPLPSCAEVLGPEHLSDWVRLYVVSTFGGAWLDVTTIHTTPVEAWIQEDAPGCPVSAPETLFGFGSPWDPTIMETWAFAAPRNSVFMEHWYGNFNEALSMGFERFIDTHRADVPESLAPHLPYLTINFCWVLACRTLPTVCIKTLPSVQDGGPFALHNACGWNEELLAHRLCQEPQSAVDVRFFIKLRGIDRRACLRFMEANNFVDDSFMALLLGYRTSSPPSLEHKRELWIPSSAPAADWTFATQSTCTKCHQPTKEGMLFLWVACMVMSLLMCSVQR